MGGPVGWGGKGLRALLALGMSKVRLVSVSCRLRCCKTVLSRWPTTRTVIGGLKTVKQVDFTVKYDWNVVFCFRNWSFRLKLSKLCTKSG